MTADVNLNKLTYNAGPVTTGMVIIAPNCQAIIV